MDKFPSVNELMEMAKNNPEMLDKLQQEETQKIIDNASTEESKRKLKGLSFKINAIKQKNGKNQMKTVVELNELMHQSKEELRKTLSEYIKKETQPKAGNNLKLIKKD